MVFKINELENSLALLTDTELKEKVANLKELLQSGSPIEHHIVEAFAIVKNTCRRLVGTKVTITGYEMEWNMIPYDVQILGGLVMHHSAIAEMQTGEGKTLTAAFPLFIRALTGKSTHIITVNDYLAKRDSEWTKAIFEFHSLSVAAITSETNSYTSLM